VTPGDFIEVYPATLSAAQCAGLIERFEASGEATRGVAGGGVDTRYKNSWDITISGRPPWADAVQLLNDVMFGCLLRYIRRYAYAVLGPHWLALPDPATGEKKALDAEALANLPDEILRAVVAKVFRPGSINLQKYLGDEGGYPRWHCELAPNRDRFESLHRTLLWTVYLNDTFAEGETEFLYQERKIAPQTGSLLIAPTAFTHTHRGNKPKGGDKYIATSWILFQRAEAISVAR
jgi:hypothetical protein